MEGGPRTFDMRANMLRLAPVVDGYVLPDDVMTMLSEGTATSRAADRRREPGRSVDLRPDGRQCPRGWKN